MIIGILKLLLLVVFSILIAEKSFAQLSVTEKLNDTIPVEVKKSIEIPTFNLIDPDTIFLGKNDELIFDSYCALGQPYVYDALHSFNYRRSDKFGGYINVKINAGLERIRAKGFKSDIKKLYIQIDPETLTVYWFAVVGPSHGRHSYVRVDSRGSAGGYLKAVEKQLPRMHGLYPDLVPEKFLEFNDDVIACYNWDGKQLSCYTSAVNIQQHFFKYRKRFENERHLKSESKLDSFFEEEDEKIDVQQDSTAYVETPVSEITLKKPLKEKKPKVNHKKYKVKSGDTLSEIAEKFHTSIQKIKSLNGLKSDNLSIGQSLKIPN